MEGHVAESVDERVLGRDDGGGLNRGECVAGWWCWRRRRSACGAGGSGVNEAVALCWRRMGACAWVGCGRARRGACG